MKIKSILAAVAIAMTATTASSAVMPSPIVGTYYDTGGFNGLPGGGVTGTPLTNSLTAVEAFLATAPVATATFNTSGIDYNNVAPHLLGTVGEFLGVDAASLSAPVAGDSFLGSVLVFVGQIDLMAGINIFDIFSDDGFSLKIGGVEIGRQEPLRAPGATEIVYDAGLGGISDFELIYFEGSLTQATLTATLNGISIGTVPVPAGLPLLLGGIAVFGGLRMRKKCAA